MRFNDVFSIIGPSMIGPSSSHTAGAVTIGRAARHLLGTDPGKAVIELFGSFAATYKGHGTDCALAGGLLGFRTDDPRIPEALALAERSGLQLSFGPGTGSFPHPNTARLTLETADGSHRVSVVGTSIGGGNVEVVEVDGYSVRFTCRYPTLAVFHRDRPGLLAELTALLRNEGANIGQMSLDRKSRNGESLAVLELDGSMGERELTEIRRMPGVSRAELLDLHAHAEKEGIV